jgi:hypothetical protein
MFVYTKVETKVTKGVKVDCSGKRPTRWSVGKFEDFETHFRIK